jgi:hypothetical protein
MKVFHGSNVKIDAIDLSRGLPYKDFGQGFYVTTIVHHAENRAIDTAKDFGGKPVVTSFEFDETALPAGRLSVKQFPTPSEEWVKFVMRCRDNNLPQPPHHYDIVEGPVANDRMRLQFALFEAGNIDLETVLKRITYIEATHQISFHTPAAIALLTPASKPEPDCVQTMMQAIIALVAGYLVKDKGIEPMAALNVVYNSATCERLLNRDTGLYRESAAYVYELLKKEL